MERSPAGRDPCPAPSPGPRPARSIGPGPDPAHPIDSVGAWTADGLGGAWTPRADTGTHAFIRSADVTFAAGRPAWARDFGHGGMIRDGADQTLAIDPCRLRFLCRGMDPAASGDCSRLP
ncbi:non-reducing end alpha-L-arabinofuranosidase family hydrolase [Streptomyces sp. NPDC051315]|uniref:non-reducing end alpha-L-arabinofuranosidase family hydrolase n=1 Tax=Streptomyces sp. NPDC051315 TaxID=3365650 RepID=UPI003791F111